jgi:hypothetical protein
MSSQLHVNQWQQIFANTTLADAIFGSGGTGSIQVGSKRTIPQKDENQ